MGADEVAAIAAAGMAAGAINTLVGSGTLITFPALVSVLGPTPMHQVIANATNTVALCPGSATGAWAYRRELGEARRWMRWLLAPSLIGGIAGALILVYAPAKMFALLVPWLILLATLLFLFQPAIARWTGIGRPHAAPSRMRIAATLVFQFLVALYVIDSRGYQTISLGAATLVSAQRPIDWNIAAAVGVVTVIPIFIFSLLVQPYIVRGLTAGAVK